MLELLPSRWFIILLLSLIACLDTTPAAQSPFPSDSEIQALARKGAPVADKAGIVIGLLNPDGSTRVVNASDVPYDGRTLFEIGSITKVFTGILLAEMAERGEVRLEDPVQDLLPKGVVVPSRNGKQIRLVDLATHSSGLPRMPDNFAPANPANPYADYSAEKLYAFLRGHQLTRDIGVRGEYSNVGVGLLGHALSLRAGKSYEALVTERVLAPLGMTSTRIVLTPEDRARLAPGHSAGGVPVANWDLDALAGAGALRSSADDMLKFLAANLNPPPGTLGRAIRIAQTPRSTIADTTKTGLLWIIYTTRFGQTIPSHNGGTAGYRTWSGFDPERRMGVVVLSNRSNSVDRIGLHLMDPRTPVSVAGIERGFHVLPATMASLLVIAIAVSFRRTGATWRRTVFVTAAMLFGVMLWMATSYLLGLFGLLTFAGQPPTMPILLVVMTALAIGLGVSSIGGRLATGLPLWILVGSQAFRLPLELLMHEAYESGLMPKVMSFSGYNFDIVTGSSAIVVAALLLMRRATTSLVRAWNILGTLLLINVVTIALLAAPTPFRVFKAPPPNTWVTTAPYVWLPTVLVALAILGHILVYRALSSSLSTQTRCKVERMWNPAGAANVKD